MATTYTLIGSVTVGAGSAASVSFTSIPTGYTDLVFKGSLRANAADGGSPQISTLITVNSASGSHRFIYGDGSSAASSYNGSTLWTYANGSTTTSNTFGNLEIYFPNYLSAVAKSYSVDSVVENNATAGMASLDAGLTSSTSAITTITLTPNSGSWVQYSTAYLYGVNNA